MSRFVRQLTCDKRPKPHSGLDRGRGEVLDRFPFWVSSCITTSLSIFAFATSRLDCVCNHSASRISSFVWEQTSRARSIRQFSFSGMDIHAFLSPLWCGRAALKTELLKFSQELFDTEQRVFVRVRNFTMWDGQTSCTTFSAKWVAGTPLDPGSEPVIREAF